MFHQSTENLIIGILIKPIITIMLDILLALSPDNINLWEKILATKSGKFIMIKKTKKQFMEQ